MIRPRHHPKDHLSVAKNFLAATGNIDFGYFGGGVFGGGSIVDRVDYSNDTGTAPARGPLSRDHGYLAAASSRENALPLKGPGNLEAPVAFGALIISQGTDFGYYAKIGTGPVSTIDRIDYSNDTATAAEKGLLTVARYGAGATGNASFGYFGGGYTGDDSVSTVDRVDYSNDTATASPRGPLSFRKSHWSNR